MVAWKLGTAKEVLSGEFSKRRGGIKANEVCRYA